MKHASYLYAYLWPDELAAKSVLYMIIYSEYTMVSGIWTVLLGEWHNLTKMWWVKFGYTGTTQSKDCIIYDIS